MNIKVIIGLGNPGTKYHNNRHNIGFLVLDALADKYNASWQTKADKEIADVEINGHKITLIKPQTFMNSSGKIIPSLSKQGIKAENILVVHDELEKPFGKVETRTGGSHRGHNGLRSIMEACGADFHRLRVGIGRPENKEDVPNYVLSNFSKTEVVEPIIDTAVDMIEALL
ncbi:MAG TPA: aminoacyl-tRNA hydrolase [Candidatus Babeliales bacterium]|nr:aminoacyl-tRNA hydrolase [Candidatus Babeliales bacterium]